MRPLKNVTKIVIGSSRQRPGSSDFKDFLDSPPTRGMTEKGLFQRSLNIIK